jgi:hypothetical protein
VAGDACALFAERLLGDLHYNFLTGLEHFRDQLWTALRSAVTAIAALATAMMSMSVVGTRAPVESAASAAPVRATTAIASVAATTAIPASTAERPLEARTIISTDARGIARKVFAHAARVWSTRFARKQDRVLLRRGSCGDLLRFSFVAMVVMLRVLFGIFLVVLIVFFVSVIVVFEINMIAESRDVQRVFMGRVGFRLSHGLWSIHEFFAFRLV